MVDLSQKIKLFSGEIIFETLRQWCVLILGIFLLIWFFRSAYKLQKTFKTWFVLDIILILVLWVRVFLFLVFEFLLPTRFFQYLADLLYLGVIVLIFYMFANAIFPVDKHRIFNKTVYTGGMIAVLFILFITSLIDFNNAFLCDSKSDSSATEIHSLLINILEMIIGIGNIVLAYYINKRHLKDEALETNNAEQLRKLLNQAKDLKDAKIKLWAITIGCFICSIFRVCRSFISEILIDHSDNYICEQNMYFVALDNVTDLFIWYCFIVSFLPTILLLYWLYYYNSGSVEFSNQEKHQVRIIDSDVEDALSSADDEYVRHEATPELMRPKKTISSPEKNNSSADEQDSLEIFLAKEYQPRFKKSTRINKNGRKYSKNDSNDRATAIN